MTSQDKSQEIWTRVIDPDSSSLDLKIREIWSHRDLVLLLVKRDFISQYKQTILGPAWHFIQPLFITVVFTIVFGRIAKISTDGAPPFLFYMSGTILWTYFSTLLTTTANTFIDNSHIFGKVYFPRLVIPIAKLVSGLIAFSIQLLFFAAILLYYLFKHANFSPNMWILMTPVLVLMLAGLALGMGAVISSVTTRYRDLIVLVSFGVQLMMYATPVIYPLSVVPEQYRAYVLLNPVTPIVEFFRYAFLGTSSVELIDLAGSFITILVILVTGIVIFNRVERNFMDTI